LSWRGNQIEARTQGASSPRSGVGTRGRALLAAVIFAAAWLVPSYAAAGVSIYSFSAIPSTTQAGGHPNLSVAFSVSNHQRLPTPCACDDAKDTEVHLPTGLIANPHATPQCDIALFASDECPVDSQLGVVESGLSADAYPAGTARFIAPLYNLIPPPNQPALLGFKSGLLDTPTFEDVSSRTNSDYGVDFDVFSAEHFFPVASFKQLTWGVPAAPANDYLRFARRQTPKLAFGGSATEPEEGFCDANGKISTEEPATVYQLCHISGASSRPGAVGEAQGFLVGESGPGYPIPSDSPAEPFLQNPTTCGVSSLTTSLDVLAYDGGRTHADSSWPPTTACEQLAFNPSQAISPTTEEADSPSGAELHLTVPQFESPSVPSPSELRSTTVTLPAGYTLAPNAANGKDTCTEAEARTGPYASTEEGQCPEDSKVGSISVETPVLPGPLPGYAYLGEPKPGQRFRLFFLLNGFGLHIKLSGTITPDPNTGQLQISFNELPQTPFASFNVHIFGSERGPLATPTQCGAYEVQSVFTPWDGALTAQASRQVFNVSSGPNGQPCPSGPRPFGPGFRAASSANTAAAHTSFWLDLTRSDGEQNLSHFSLTTPPGFSATLKGVPYCSPTQIEAAQSESHSGLAEQASPSCPIASQIGESIAGAGAGDHPLFLPGKVYLSGPYEGAPLSLVVITPAVSGGYDLGNVVVRAALRVNPETAQVTAVSDPLPQIFQGIPLRLRQVFVNLNRPAFALNPTDCNPLSVDAQIFGNEGAGSIASQHFQVANCASLPFAPRLSMRFTGSTRRAGNPALDATVEYPKGGPYANIASAAVTLPPTELIDNAHITDPCTKVQFAQGLNPGEKCPSGSVIGYAKAETPLLEKPLQGPVYLRSAPENKGGLPDLVAALNGQIDITLDGKITTVDGNRLRTTFAAVPDAPVSRFTLSLDGGHRGLLENNGNLCAQPLRVNATIAAQNNKSADQSPRLRTPCGQSRRHGPPNSSRGRRGNRGGAR
jgi:hypothetical protein